jgi:hypothetical protein
MAETGVRKAAQRLRKRAGSKPGKARAANLTAEERSAQARYAADARWGKVRKARDAEAELIMEAL